MTNALTQIRGAALLQTIESRSLSNAARAIGSRRAIARVGRPPELPELNCWSIEKHAIHRLLKRSTRRSCAVANSKAPGPRRSGLRSESQLHSESLWGRLSCFLRIA